MKLGNLKKAREEILRELLLTARLGDGQTRYGFFCEAHLFVQSQKLAEVGSALQSASFIYPDGISLILRVRMAGYGKIRRHPSLSHAEAFRK